MTVLKLHVNVPVDAVTSSDILRDATQAVVRILGEPQSSVMILLNHGLHVALTGTEAPAAFAELISPRGVLLKKNEKLSSTLADVLERKLSIPSSRFFINHLESSPDK